MNTVQSSTIDKPDKWNTLDRIFTSINIIILSFFIAMYTLGHSTVINSFQRSEIALKPEVISCGGFYKCSESDENHKNHSFCVNGKFQILPPHPSGAIFLKTKLTATIKYGMYIEKQSIIIDVFSKEIVPFSITFKNLKKCPQKYEVYSDVSINVL